MRHVLKLAMARSTTYLILLTAVLDFLCHSRSSPPGAFPIRGDHAEPDIPFVADGLGLVVGAVE
jgi:hypothetical protein